MTTKFSRKALVAMAVIGALAAAGCGSSSKKTTTGTTVAPAAAATTATTGGTTVTTAGTTATTAASLFSMLPQSVQSAKEIKVGSDVSYAPIEFFKLGTQQVQGVDYDLGQALGAALGVKVTFINSTFDGLITAMTTSGRFDMIMSAMTDNTTRQKTVDFVDYFTAGTAILVAKGNPKHIQSLADLCGKTVALQKGTTQETLAMTQNKTCTSAGKGKINLLSLGTDTDALQQLKIGRSDADMNDFPVAAYNAQTSGGGNDFEVAGQQFQSAPYGIAFAKTNTQLRDAVQAALKAIIADGTYDKVLSTWQVSSGALKTAQVNGGTSS